jgi:mRNA-degrading endonuclease toxin of MazEF toxin-antitoxin module
MKIFLEWIKIKINLHDNKHTPVYFYEREIWFVHLGHNIGFEQNGKGNKFLRPVLIIKKYNKDLCTVVALTSSKKNGKYYMYIEGKEHASSTVILSQIKTISSRRLVYKKGMVSKDLFIEIKKRIKLILNIA